MAANRAAVSAALALALGAVTAAACGDAQTPVNNGGTPGAQGGPASGGSVGATAPEITAELVVGDGPSTLAAARGKVTVLDFWATHCDPCRKSFPEYQKLVDQFAGQVQVIAVATDKPEDVEKEQILEFVKQTGVKFAIVWDKTEATAMKYNPPNLPTSYVIDQQGVVRHVHDSYTSGEEQKIIAEVKALLNP